MGCKKNSKYPKPVSLYMILALVLLMKGMPAVFSQVNYSQTWATGDLNSWVSSGSAAASRTTSNVCATTGSVRANPYSSTYQTMIVTSPNLGPSSGGVVTMSYQYKIINFSGGAATPNTFGNFSIQYASSTSGTWTTAQTISTDHIPSTSCATKSITFTPPAGDLYVRLSVTRAAGDFYFYFDEVSLSQAAPPNCNTVTFPSSVNATASKTSICIEESLNFGLDAAMPAGTGITYQWQSSPDNITYTNNGASASSSTATLTANAAAKWFRCIVSCNGAPVLTSNPVQVNLLVQVLTTTAGSRCGTGEVTLGATGAAGNTLSWYAGSSGGSVLNTGTSFTTPSIAATTDYYVSAKGTSVTDHVGPGDPRVLTPAGDMASTNNGIATYFNLAEAKTLQSVTIYPLEQGGAASNTIGSNRIILLNSSDIVLYEKTITITTAEANSTKSFMGTPMVLTLNWDIPAGSGYKLKWNNGDVCPACGALYCQVLRNLSGAAGYYSPASSAGVTFTGNSGSGTAYWYGLYDWVFTTGCGESPRTKVTATVSNGDNTWDGSLSTNWFAADNWSCNTVPTAVTNVTIPAGVPRYPLVTVDTALVNKITIAATASLTVKDAGALQVGDVINNSGLLDVYDGCIKLSGASLQTLSGNSFYKNTVKNLVVKNTSVQLNNAVNDTLVIIQSLSFGDINNAVFNTNNNLILRSGNDTTARVADITNNGSNHDNAIVGSAIVERYIPARRAWRLLTAPVNNPSLTINQAWQDGHINTGGFTQGNLAGWSSINVYGTPGRGTHITGGATRNDASWGFDESPYQPSIKAYDNGWGTAVYGNVSTTNDLDNGGRINDRQGYMLFVRGDRTIELPFATTAAPKETVLRPYGPLNIGDKKITLPPGTGFKVVGNPYASAINFDAIRTRNSSVITTNAYYLWDPKLTGSSGVGAFVAFAYVSPGIYSPTVYSPSTQIIPDGDIASGAAFLVQSATGGDIFIHETDKVADVKTKIFFRPAKVAQLRTNLLAVNADGSKALNDGLLVLFDEASSNTVNADDVPKQFNFSESIALQRNGKWLAAEKRMPVGATDTLLFFMNGMRLRNYQLEIFTENLEPGRLMAVLEDKFLGTKTPVSLSSKPVLIDFSITADTASKAYNRFQLIFEKIQTLPLTFTSIKAERSEKNVAGVDWTVASEMKTRYYEIERSVNGIDFIKVKTIPAFENKNYYTCKDTGCSSSLIFYRVVSVDIANEKIYSSIVKLDALSAEGNITALITQNNIVSLRFNNIEKGDYTIRILNSLGQPLYNKKHNYNGVVSGTVNINKLLTKGTYFAEVTGRDKRYALRIIK
ncbi:MAG: hypothetical protein QM791_01275 [Ferruginibacter sp.]